MAIEVGALSGLPVLYVNQAVPPADTRLAADQRRIMGPTARIRSDPRPLRLTMPQPYLETPSQELGAWLTQQNQPKYRQAQIHRWVFSRRAADWAAMTDLPQQLRHDLADQYRLWTTEIARHTTAADGTEKLLLRLTDGRHVECVLLRDGRRRTICVSSQVGCGMGCVFCASGLGGVERNLTTGEILEQMLRLDRLLPPDDRLSHIVMMGMGEPLANLEAVLEALETVSRADSLGISGRRITISTVGIPRAMRRLAERDVHYRLAVSLHAPNDALRNELVPIHEKLTLQEILTEADYFFSRSGRRITFEYVLLAGINDQPEHASQLAALLTNREALVNVIPYNPVAGLPYQTPSGLAQRRFREVLESRGIRVRFRHRKGDKISAACGQLRRVEERTV